MLRRVIHVATQYSVLTVQILVVTTVCTACPNTKKNSALCPHSVFTCFETFSKPTSTLCLYSIK